ncbi:MAG: FHA domain-containing protein, partial [Kofleriaceae bacterium]
MFLAGPIAGRRYALEAGEYVIGRRSDCQIFVPDMRVSRQHARVVAKGDSWCLEDLGSNNGTYINGARLIETLPIRANDEITIADNRIRVEADGGEDRKGDQRVTILPGGSGPVIRSREDRPTMISSGMTSLADQRAVRLIERKLEALT